MKQPGTLDNPIVVNSAGDEQFAGCTGYPADSHWTIWCLVRPPSPLIPSFPLPSYSSPTLTCLRQTSLPPTHLPEPTFPKNKQKPTNQPTDKKTKKKQMTRERPVERCGECGSVYRMEYIGPPDDPHAHDDHGDGHGHQKHEEPKTLADYVRPEYRGTPQPLYGQT